MNNVIKFINSQYGLCPRERQYDSILSRLCVDQRDNWKGITPSTYGSDYNPEPPIFSAKFSNSEGHKHILAIANEDGKIAIQDTTLRNNEPTEVSLEGEQCHYNAVFDLEWMPGHMKFVSASGDHTARLWEITESKLKMTRMFSGHTRSVKTAAFRRTDPAVFATGGRDGAILIWDTRATLNVDALPRADNCIYSGHAGGPGTPQSAKRKTRQTPKLPPNVCSSSITGLAFQDDYTLVSCGAGDGIVKVWDLRRNYTSYKKEPLPKFSIPYAGSSTFKGFTNLLIDNSGMRLYVNCMDSNIYCYNLSTYSSQPIQQYSGFKNSTFYIKSCLSPDGQYLISGSSDEKAYIWNINNPLPVVALTGHTVEVTCVAWSQGNDTKIVTCSDDARHKIWHIGPEFIADDEKVNYKGRSEICKDYKKNFIKSRLKVLEYTPRSIRRLVERNEKTPTSTEKTNKRTFTEMTDNIFEKHQGSDQKRPHIETKGRRLFSPSTSYASTSDFHLPAIIEETEKQILSPRLLSPLTERIDSNLKTPESSSSRQIIQNFFSPTLNLPNFVMDGLAPHLRIISPKKKLKENVDWLTKIRKQKLLTTNSTIHLNDKLSQSDNFEANDLIMSPRVQTLKRTDRSPSVNGTPKRRLSRSGSSSEISHSKTPSRRHSSETTILKFFQVTHTSTASIPANSK